MEVGALGGLDADPGSDVALIVQRLQGGQNVLTGGGDVVGGAGFDVAGPDRIPGEDGEDLDVPAMLLVFTGSGLSI